MKENKTKKTHECNKKQEKPFLTLDKTYEQKFVKIKDEEIIEDTKT